MVRPVSYGKSVEKNRAAASVLLGRVTRRNREEIQVRRTAYAGRDLIDVRVYRRDAAGELHRTAQGICAPLRVWRRVAAALVQGLGAAEALALVGELGGGEVVD